MIAGVSIRAARADDADAARDLTDRSWRVAHVPPLGDTVTAESIMERHAPATFAKQASVADADPNAFFLVAEAGGDVVEHCRVFVEAGRYVDDLHVAPEIKGHGIDRAILDHVEERQPLGTWIWLEVLCGNDQAMAFYRRVGFRQSGETDAVRPHRRHSCRDLRKDALTTIRLQAGKKTS